MSVRQLDVNLDQDPWELEEPRRRPWSPVELEFITRSGLLPFQRAELRSGRIFDSGSGEPVRWDAEAYERTCCASQWLTPRSHTALDTKT